MCLNIILFCFSKPHLNISIYVFIPLKLNLPRSLTNKFAVDTSLQS